MEIDATRPATWDAIVIGSGIGGLSAAGLLAAVAGKRVLVLEKHSEPGGLTHVFRRDGASWDVGVHYVGEMEEGSMMRSFFDFLSGGQLRWNRMTDEFERFIYPELSFSVPSNPDHYLERLISRFPDEEKALRRYFQDIRSVQRWDVLGFAQSFMPPLLGFFIRQYQQLTGAKATQTTGTYLNRHFRSPLLRALLASQWGDYGLPPSQSAFAIHAQIVGHYFNGAWFPEGGSSRIARTFEKGIESRGGAVRVCQDVTAILTRDGTAVGVKAIDNRGAAPREVTYHAPVIISNAGAPITYERLLPRDGDIGARTQAVRALIGQLDSGPSAVTLYLRLKAPASTLGIQGENYWISNTTDHDAVREHGVQLLQGHPSNIYLSFPSAKSGEDRFHTAEIVALVDDGAFVSWKDQPKGNRGKDYADLKERISHGLLALAETAVPGLAALVEYMELATPLTMEHYTSHPRGRFYGLPANPARYKSALLGSRTPIGGLYLSGSDAGCLGIVGAMMGGVGAAAQALGPRGFPRIQAALKSGKTAPSVSARPLDKKRAVLERKTALTPSIWKLQFRLDQPIDFVPGQFARLCVGEWEWRDYSIAAVDGLDVTFLISNRTGGHGSDFVNAVRPGDPTEIELPLGGYALAKNRHRKVFVATGTGLAPFLPMFQQLERDGATEDAELYFGCRTRAEDITANFAQILPRTTSCISREEPGAKGFKGRVTEAIAKMPFDPVTTDFYLCGSAAMVADCRTILERAGAIHLHVEAY